MVWNFVNSRDYLFNKWHSIGMSIWGYILFTNQKMLWIIHSNNITTSIIGPRPFYEWWRIHSPQFPVWTQRSMVIRPPLYSTSSDYRGTIKGIPRNDVLRIPDSCAWKGSSTGEFDRKVKIFSGENNSMFSLIIVEYGTLYTRQVLKNPK